MELREVMFALKKQEDKYISALAGSLSILGSLVVANAVAYCAKEYFDYKDAYEIALKVINISSFGVCTVYFALYKATNEARQLFQKTDSNQSEK